MDVEVAAEGPLLRDHRPGDPMALVVEQEEEGLGGGGDRASRGSKAGKRWAHGRFASTEHLVLKKNKRHSADHSGSPLAGYAVREEPGDSNYHASCNYNNNHNHYNNNNNWALLSQSAKVENNDGLVDDVSRETGLTGSDESFPTRGGSAAAPGFEPPTAPAPLADWISDEVLLHIFRCGLAWSDLRSVGLVCRRWWHLSQDRLLRRWLGRGRAYVVGGGGHGQLGLGQRVEQLDRPTPLRALEQVHIRRVCAARRHSVVVDDEGRLYSFGSGEDGKLGHGNELDQLLPKQVATLAGQRIVDVSCGVHHTLAVTETGRLYSFGFAACGQLGHGDQSNRTLPTEVKALAEEQIVACAAGAHHSLAVTRGGRVYSFGLGHTGQLGHGDENYQMITYQLTPKPIAALEGVRIVSAAAGFFNSLLLADDGRVFSFGSGGNGKLGHGDQANQLVPKQIAALAQHRVVKVSAGPCHTLALTAQGLVFSFGNGQNGRLGHMDEQYAFTPRVVAALQHEKVVDVAAGECHSLALTEDGRVFFFGAVSAHGRVAGVWVDRSMLGGGSTSSSTSGVGFNSAVGQHGGMRLLEVSRNLRLVGIAAGGTHSLLHT